MSQEPGSEEAEAAVVVQKRRRISLPWLAGAIVVIFAVLSLFLSLGQQAATQPPPDPVGGGQGSGGGGFTPVPTPEPGKQLPAPNKPLPTRSSGAAGWYYWLDEDPRALPVPRPQTAPLGPERPHHLQFRLSPIDLARMFQGVDKLAMSSGLTQTLQAAVADDKRSELKLEVLVHSADDTRLLVAPESRRQTLRIDLKAVRLWRGQAAASQPAADPRLAQALAAASWAEFAIELTLLQPGEHQIGIVIIDAASGYPLQSMLATVSSGQPWPQSVRVLSSGDTLFSSRSAPLDLVLYLFDLESRMGSNTTRGLQAQLRYVDPQSRQPALIAWKSGITMEGLVQNSSRFTDVAGTQGDAERLREEGVSLGRHLFSPTASPRFAGTPAELDNQRQAEMARAVIHAAAAYGEGTLPPSMLVRLVTMNSLTQSHGSDVLPMAAMGVQGPRDSQAAPVFLGERFGLALALPDQPVATATACAREWYIATPQADLANEGPLGDALRGLEPVRKLWLESASAQRQSASLDTLKTWIGDEQVRGRSTVFTFLGHHDRGELFLQNGVTGVNVGDMARVFGPGSVAILNACISAVGRVNDGTPVGRLSQQGVAATVATTSKISGHLAAAYMDCLGGVLARHDRLTVGQAQALTTQCLWAGQVPAASGKRYNYGGAALKYMIFGDPSTPLCSPSKVRP